MDELYEQDIKSSIAALEKWTGSDRDADARLRELHHNIQTYKLQVGSLPAPSRSSVLARISQYEQRHRELQAALQKKMLMERGGESALKTVERTMERHKRIGESVTESRRMAEEAADIGVSILSTMEAQRQQIMRARATLARIDDQIATGRTVLKKMQ